MTKQTIHFTGTVHPERACVNISKLSVDSNLGQIEIEIGCSVVSVILLTESSMDIVTLKNGVTDFVAGIVDALGYVNGCGYFVEIKHAANMETSECMTFGVNFPIFNERYPKKEWDERINNIVSLMAGQRGLYLSRALADMREAIRSAKDTAFFVFRAIETLKQYFGHKFGISDDGKKWCKMAHEIGGDERETKFIRGFSDDNRHGVPVELTADKRLELLETAARIIDRFIEYELANQSLKPTENSEV